MVYSRIEPLETGLDIRDAEAVDALATAWYDRIEEMKGSKSLERFNDQLYRRWAIETGILERLYSIDRGVTEILVERGLDVSLLEHGSTDAPPEQVISMLRDHRDAVQYVMDFVAGNQELSVHFIRSLHQILTRNQEFVDAVDQFGSPVKIKLLKGVWKERPNNPTRPDGQVHQYCPPELVQEEMESMLKYFEQEENTGVPTTVLSAFLHHRFTQIHPFQDGNGRVARALAAFVFVRAKLFPIVIEREERGLYIDCLEQADGGRLDSLVQLWNRLERQSLESALSLSDSILDDSPFAPSGILRTKLLDAIRDQAIKRRKALQAAQMSVIPLGNDIFRQILEPAFEDLRDDLEEVLKGIDREYECSVDAWAEDRGHWFRGQLIEIARVYGYFCDVETYHRWVRLKIWHKRNTEEVITEIVVSLHSLGRFFAGVLVLSGFAGDRERDDDGRTAVFEPNRLSDRPLSFSYSESPNAIHDRCREWLEVALNVGLERFRRRL